MVDYNITEVYLTSNELTDLPDDICKYTNLEFLDCSDNQITSLDNLPHNLEELRCSYNQLTSQSR